MTALHRTKPPINNQTISNTWSFDLNPNSNERPLFPIITATTRRRPEFPGGQCFIHGNTHSKSTAPAVMPRHNYLFLLLLAFLEPTTSSIFWDPEYTYVTTSFCNATDTAQHWTYNSSTSQIWSKQQFVNTKKQRCLSLAPNALNLDISSISVCKSAYIGEIKTSQSTLRAYDSEFLSSMCREHLQNFDHWNNEQYHNFANLVTRNCDDVFYHNVDAPWMSYHTVFSLPRWTYDAYPGSITIKTNPNNNNVKFFT